MSAAAARQPLGALGVRSAAVLWAAIVDWLSEWRDASHHDDERPRIAVSLLMAALACAGALLRCSPPSPAR
jgi:hypothetical protein